MKIRKVILVSTIFLLTFIHYAEADETQIFYEDFESEADNWDLLSGWSIISEDGNHFLQGTKHAFASAYLDGTVNTLELELKLLQGTIHLNIRSEPSSEGLKRYFIGFNKDGSYIQKQLGDDFQPLAEHGRSISLNEWHKIKIEIIQDTIEVFSDNKIVFSIHDKAVIQEGGISFETLENSKAYIDKVRVEVVVPESRQIKARDLFHNGEHKGDIILKGRDFLRLENGTFKQFGNVYLKDSSRLALRDTTFYISRYQRLLNHWGIYLEDKASLEIKDSKLIPGKEVLVVVHAKDRAKVNMKNSPTKIHLFTMSENAEASVEDSEIVGSIGGLVGANGKARVKVSNSKIGAVNLWIPSGTTFEASGLCTGFFKEWNLQEDTKVSGIDYNITLTNTELVKDTIGPGPFERGWPVFIDSSANVNIKDSELRKVVIELHEEKAEFTDFALDKSMDFQYRNIHLENVTVKGQWGIFMHGSSEVTVRDSDAFWTFIYGDSILTLINTHMNEFDPRNFHGQVIFKNSRWDTAAEIIQNNDFTIKGSLKIGKIGGFSWEDSKVTRVYDVIGKPNTELILEKEGTTVWQGKTDEDGKVSFSIKFDDTHFSDFWKLRDKLGIQIKVGFFSNTPIKLPLN
jgi:hypothetical protein